MSTSSALQAAAVRLRTSYPGLASRIRGPEDLKRLSPEALAAALKAVDQAFRRMERALFASEGSSGGSQWSALSPRYAKWKKRRYPGRKILQLKGQLRRSLAELGGQHIARAHYDGTHGLLEVGTSVPYATYHHEGTGRMPKRDPIQMTAEQKAELKRVAIKAIMPELLRSARDLAVSGILGKGR
jgi:phage gpG-like protein